MEHLPPIVGEKEFQDVDTLDEEKIKESFGTFLNRLHLFLNQSSCIHDIQEIRSNWTKVRYKEAFGNFATDRKHWYTFNHGGRKEAQFNIGLCTDYLRIGLGFEFTEKKGGDPTIVQLSYACFTNVIKNELKSFQQFVDDNQLEVEWCVKDGKNSEIIPTKNVVNWLIEPTMEPEWIFIGRLLRREIDKEILENPIYLKQNIDTVFKGFKPIWKQTQIMAEQAKQ